MATLAEKQAIAKSDHRPWIIKWAAVHAWILLVPKVAGLLYRITQKEEEEEEWEQHLYSGSERQSADHPSWMAKHVLSS